MIREFVGIISGLVFHRKKEEQPNDFMKLLISLGDEKLQLEMAHFKGSNVHRVMREYYAHAQAEARERLMTCDPDDHTTIAYCQAYSSLVLLFDGLVDHLSSITLDQEMGEHLPETKELI
jgi:hypothetical protein